MRNLVLAVALLFSVFAGLSRAADTSEQDRGFLTAYLEDNLSGYGRAVRITGFAGALSSRATFDRMTIADDTGVWLTIDGGAISWNRTALLSGRVEINELSAKKIELTRFPAQQKSAVEASSGFSLPVLPVSVLIGKLATQELTLGQAVLGREAKFSIAGTANLEGGSGNMSIEVRRTDGAEGQITLSGTYSSQTQEATLDLLASEGADGIAANLLGLPGKPALQLALHGSGPTSDFRTDLALSTAGQPRITGAFKTGSLDKAGRSFSVWLTGDLSPLLQPEYATFFGTHTQLEAEGAQLPDGQLDLTRLVIDSDAADISGRLSLTPDRLPSAAALTIRLGLADENEVRLPLTGTPSYVRNGVLTLRYDQKRGDEWRLAGDLSGYRREGLSLDSLNLDGTGEVRMDSRDPGNGGGISGRLGFMAQGIHVNDPSLAQAIGTKVEGQTNFDWRDGKPLRLSGLSVTTAGLAATGAFDLTLDGLDVAADGSLRLNAPDVSRFSGIMGRPLGGSAEITLAGAVSVMSGAFDLDGTVIGNGIRIDNSFADRMLAGPAVIEFSAKRSTEGILLRKATVKAATLSARAQGTLSSQKRDMTAELGFSDLSVLGDGFGGALKATAKLTGDVGVGHFALDGIGTGLQIGTRTIAPIFAGETALSVMASERDGQFMLDGLTLKNHQAEVSLAATGVPGTFDLGATLNNVALIAPGFPGSAQIKGSVSQSAEGYQLDISGKGPGGASMVASGSLSSDFAHADLKLTGSGQAALLNGVIAPRSVKGLVNFDLRLAGPPHLASLTGSVAAGDIQLAAPADGLTVETGSAMADIVGGTANLSGTFTLRGGGTVAVSGPIKLTAPFEADLAAEIDHLRLLRPRLFDSVISGQLAISGPLLSGAVIGGDLTLNDTEITVGQLTYNGDAIPIITHVNESAASRATRLRAGLDATGAIQSRNSVSYGLDIGISAPGHVFVRGLGLDAELSGNMRLNGTLAHIVPSGQLDLLRGRLNVLGKRFVLDDGRAQLLGSLVPYIDFSASTDAVGSTATVVVSGPANAPELHFTSSSGLPEEEVLAQLIFGANLGNVSAFQLVQLANTVATLSGRGGEGLSNRLRKRFGLDDLDVTVDDAGNAALKAGKYLTDRIYSEASVGLDGRTKIDLSLTVNKNLTVKGTAGTDGQSGLGIVFGKDY